MFGIVTVALLLVLCLMTPETAAAQEATTETSQKARALDLYLDRAGINNPAVRKLVNEFSARKEGRFLRLGEERFDAGRVVLHYKLQPKIGLKQMQLKYQSTDQRSEIALSTRSLMYNYKWSF
jgi:hypothetical protein